MAEVLLSLGSNLDRERYISAALDALADIFGDLELSSVYESEAVGFNGSPFLNMVVGIQTHMTVGELSKRLKQIEDNNGRRRNGPKFSSRTIDIDILTYDNEIGEVDGVLLPRDEVDKNAFVLWPLAELKPECLHPVRALSYAHLWSQYDQDQKLWPVEFYWRDQQISKRCAAVD